ncbi:MAG: hypothetical protein V2I54_09650 [Bacteroidales bacterium]|jgi:hypothetical protein|nr:hypothetical protein [Bacteroidales bacterium]
MDYDKELENKIQLKALLNTFSVEEISTLFSSIDKNLISLHECSADDFLKLNSEFKIIYTKSKIIAENIHTVLNHFNDNNSQEFYCQVEQLYHSLKARIELFDYKLEIVIDSFDKLSNHLRHIFFPMKNYCQNLMSLKYLLANLNLNISHIKGTDKVVIEQQNQMASQKIDEIKKYSDLIVKNINHLQKVSKLSIKNLQDIKQQKEFNFDLWLSKIEHVLNALKDKYKRNKRLIPGIIESSEKTTLSVDDIIKKLQYQDIIQQKMEHIQQTHRDLIEELKAFEETHKDESHLNDLAKCFLRIRDIAGLQAAQLIHANKEYQGALEIIINQFLNIGDHMKYISEKGNEILYDENGLKLYDDIFHLFSSANEILDQKFIQNKTINQDIDSLEDKIDTIDSSFRKLDLLSEDFNQLFFNTLERLQELSVDDLNSKKNIAQVKNLHSDIKNNYQKVYKIFHELKRIKKNFQESNEHNHQNRLTREYINQFDGFVNQIKESGDSIDKKLKVNQQVSREVIGIIKKAIADIKYYKFFEKVIEEIITELNTINFKLKTDDQNSELSKEENLKKLKDYYTMHSEHQVHDQILRDKAENIEIDLEEDGDIEFF